MGFRFGFGFGAGMQGGGASPPTVLTATFPAISDDTVEISGITYSAGTTHLIVTETNDQPSPSAEGWVEAASSIVYTTASSGSVTLYLWAKSPGGVSATAASGSTDVFPGLRSYLDPGLGITVAEVSTPGDSLYNVTVAANTLETLDPLGTNTARKITETVDNALHATHRGISVGPSILEIYAKQTAGSTRTLGIAQDGPGSFTIYNLTTGAVSGFAGGTTEDVGNGWWKCHSYRATFGLYCWTHLCDGAYATYSGADPLQSQYWWGIKIYQDRCSAISDQFNGADFANSSSATQPFARFDEDSPGWPGIDGGSDLWQPAADALKTVDTDDTTLCALLEAGVGWTILARVQKFANPTAAAPLVNATGTGGMSMGIGTDGKPYIAATDSATLAHASALDTSVHGVAWSTSAAGAGAIYIDASKSTGTLTPGAIEADTLTIGVRGFAVGKIAICAGQLSDAQIADCLGAMAP